MLQGEGEAHCGEPHCPRPQVHYFPRVDQSRTRGYPEVVPEENCPGEGWSVETRDKGPSVGHPCPANQETSKLQESERVDRPGRSPLTSELLAPNEQLTNVLDYEDVDEYEVSMPDPEIAQAVAHIPQADAFTNVEMQESRPPSGFEPEVSKVGYDVNLVRSNPTEPGSTSPVMARENEMLDGATSRTPGAGRPGTNEDPGCMDDNSISRFLFPERPLSIHED